MARIKPRPRGNVYERLTAAAAETRQRLEARDIPPGPEPEAGQPVTVGGWQLVQALREDEPPLTELRRILFGAGLWTVHPDGTYEPEDR
jgi:hypothetical protein